MCGIGKTPCGVGGILPQGCKKRQGLTEYRRRESIWGGGDRGSKGVEEN